MRRFDTTERRARLARRHHLAPDARASGIAEAARDLVGLHSTDPATVYLSTFTRTAPGDPEADPAAIGRTIYDDRSVVRMLGMRRTMFVEPLELVPVVHAAYARANGGQQRRATIQLLGSAGIADDPARWLAEVEAETLAALTLRGEATATEIAQDVPRLREQIPVGAGKRWEGTIGVSTRVLFGLAAEGRIIRGRPRGSWISSQYRWTTIESWLPEPLVEMSVESARVELIRRWLGAFGPGTVADIKWWTGLTLGETRRALAELGAVDVELEDGVGVARADDLEPTDPPGAVGRAAARARPDRHGLGGPRLVSGAASSARVRHQRQRRPDDLGRWTRRRWLGPAARWADRRCACSRMSAQSGPRRSTPRPIGWPAGSGSVRITPRFRTPIEKELGV